MAHPPVEEILKKVNQAKSQVVVGSQYYHYKHPDFHYTIIDIVVEESTDEPMVIYKGAGDGLTFARPIKSFLEQVEIEGKMINRFSKV